MIKVLHNNYCSKSRCLLTYLHDKGVAFEIVDIINNPLGEEEIKSLLGMGISIEELVRTNEKLFQEKYIRADLPAEGVSILAKHPELIQRPVVISGSKAIIARPMERADALL